MAFLSQQNELQQANFYAQLAHDPLKSNFIPDTEIVIHPIKTINQIQVSPLANEIGIIDTTIRVVTPDIVITTPPKIPNGMYFLDDTTPNVVTSPPYTTTTTTIEFHPTPNSNITLTTIKLIKVDGSEHSTLLFILMTALFIILLMCCITACIIARSRSKTFFIKRDIECSPQCSGVNQPLLGLDKPSDTTTTTTTKTSVSSIQN